MRTQAIIFAAAGEATLGQIELPDPQPTDVVVRVDVSGISVGTERWAYQGKRPEMAFPHVPGYLGIGTVVEVGAQAAARGWRPGMGINFNGSRLPEPYRSNSWMGTHVAHAVVDACTGVDTPPGGVSWFKCEPLPDGLAPEDAALTQLCAVAMRGIEMATIPAGSSVLVVGAGVIGLFAGQVCRLKGARVMVSDVVAGRLATAARLGVEWTVDSSRENLAERAKAVAPDGFDVIIDTASIPAVLNQVIPLLRQRGQVVFQGWYPPPSALDLHAFHIRLPTCHFPCGMGAPHVATAMRWARDGKLDCRSLLDRIIRPAEAPAFYRLMAGSSESFIGAAIDWRKA